MLREELVGKLGNKMQVEGIKSVTDADRRRWVLPGTTKQQIKSSFSGKSRIKAKHINDNFDFVPPNGKFEHWHVPFDTDLDWPKSLTVAVTNYRKA